MGRKTRTRESQSVDPRVRRRRTAASQQGDGPTGGSSSTAVLGIEEEILRWTFSLEQRTSVAAEVPKGTTVVGRIVASRVQIMAPELGALGFAPAEVASAIISAAVERPGGSLTGTVLNASAKRVTIALNLSRGEVG